MNSATGAPIMKDSLFDRCYVIAEVAQAHDGSLGAAHAFIDAVAGSGADAIKFQTHIADAESTRDEPWRVKFSEQDDTRFDYWKRMEFRKDQWISLKEHAVSRGLDFLSSPFSIEAVTLLREVGVRAWKVASGEIGNAELFDNLLMDGRPLLISTGMSSWNEIDAAVSKARQAKVEFLIMQCASRYPTPPEFVGLNLINEIRQRYDCLVGLSDHTGEVYAGLSAAVLGAKALEVHVTLSKRSFGPDVAVSLDIDELGLLVKGVRSIEAMLSNPVNKEVAAQEMSPMRSIFTRSITVKSPMKRGQVIASGDITLKKPGTGISWKEKAFVLGKKLKNDVTPDKLLQKDDLE